jgi:phage tail-like protein
MTPGLPRPPEPPHDPRSLLLNGAIGFRQQPPAPTERMAAVDPECCAVTLPRVQAALRHLAEPSGSLGGVRPPSNVALGPDGGIYLLDRVQVELKRFDPCDCAFKTVPCFGGPGGRPRQLRNPGGIAIACGNLYVCDTGVEVAPPAGACDPIAHQAALDIRIARQNHRVSVFALKGFALRGHLMPPPDERPWRPVSVAVDSLGRTWVGDANSRIHRFTPTGAWEKAWPTPGSPDHLAIDCRDRVYVIAPGAPTVVRVLDGDGKLVAPPPLTPDEIRAAFSRLPFKVDQTGNLWLERCCDERSVKKGDVRADLVFGADGQPIELKANATPHVYETKAVYRSDVLDSQIAQCIWHRVALFGSLPAGTRVGVRAFSADEILTPAELDARAPWPECATADTFESDGQWDCLVRSEPGRYLWIELVLEGNGVATPSIGAIVVEFPRVSLRRFLPAVFGMEPISADFTDRFLALFDTSLRRIERRVDRMAHLFDPASAPASAKDPRQQDFLSWLGSWIGTAVDRNWDIETRRRFLKEAGGLFDRRGTLAGLRKQVLLLLDFDHHAPCAVETHPCDRCVPAPRNCAPDAEPRRHEPPPLVLEHFRLRRWLRVGAGRLGADAVLWGERIVGRTKLGAHGQAGVTRLDTSPDPEHDPFLVHAGQFSVFVPARCRDAERTRKALENLLKTEAPAGTRGYLHFVEPRFRIGIQSMLGFDTVVGAVPQGVTLGATPLGDASILTGPPHLHGGPAVALGKDGRVGSTSVLG